MPSKRKVVPLVGRDGINGSRGAGGARDQEIPQVEIDATFASALQLEDGQKVTATIHVDPPLASTISIEPLTPEDWEMIELHATFLEINLMNQIRAVPNPSYTPSPGVNPSPHPLTLHLSPTSSANIKVLSLEPALPADAPFAKVAPEAEVIVAPKSRAKQSRNAKENRSTTGASKKSGRSSGSTVKGKGGRDERRPALFLRAIDRRLCEEWFDGEPETDDLAVWVDGDLLVPKEFRGVKWVTVTLMRPDSLQPPIDPPKQSNGEGFTPETPARVVARLQSWDDPPNGQAVALSPSLCAALGCPGIVGGIAKIEQAPQPIKGRPSKPMEDSTESLEQPALQKLLVYPFTSGLSKHSGALRFGGQSRAEKEEAGKRIKQIYAHKGSHGLLHGPITDGMILGVYDSTTHPSGWLGGVVKFDPPSKSHSSSKERATWFLGSETQIPLDVQAPIPQPSWLTASDSTSTLPSDEDILLGIDSLLADLQSHLSHLSSVLLTGGLGSGKTSVAQSLAQRLKREQLFHTTYFPCRKLVNDESRIPTIKETLNRVFMAASWGARLGGKSLVILDDLDRLCPVETELVVQSEEGRSRQISETICTIVRQYCNRDTNVVLLATAQGKDSINNVIIGGHVVREIIELRAPDKEARRTVLESMTRRNAVVRQDDTRPPTSDGSRPTTADGSAASEDGWMEGAIELNRRESSTKADGFILEDDLDLLEIAGETDGYMPGDLGLLVSRARNEALMRSVGDNPDDQDAHVFLGAEDFKQALKGFTPTSLRNVTLQHSSTTFDSIGGLKETRRVLLETLEYPTKYAPIFAQCPLRLRSGLLLYGYPGCGKTLLASAVAGECGLNFISVKGPEILNKYIGASEKSVRDLFERAQAARPCVLFFDEFDSIAPKRGHDSTGVTDRVVNQLLTQMDGAEGLSGVYVLAATSRPDLIDSALLRPGRLDKSLLCDFPGVDDRLDILRALLRKVRLADEVLCSRDDEDDDDLLELARRTDGFSGADLQALVSNAQLEAIHDALHDQAHGAAAAPTSRRGGAVAKRPSPPATGGARSFVQFRYGADEPPADGDGAPKSRSAELAEQAAIAAKLESIKLARRRDKMLKGGGKLEEAGPGKGAGQKEANKEVVVGWKHLVKALDGTRASISVDERRRLERIYREFVVGRSGEMKDGQGSMEIGGRSSLM